MSKIIVVVGYGVGISAAVASKFGKEGFTVALVARNQERLLAGVKALEAEGVHAASFPADVADPVSVKKVFAEVRSKLGPITALHWNAYGGAPGDLLTADASAIRGTFDIAVTGLLTAVQEALPDLKKAKDAAVLVTNGGLGYADPQMDAMCNQWKAMGLGLANAAKHKLVGLLADKLKGDNIYVGEVMVTGAVKGTAFDSGQATLQAPAIATKFWDLYTARKEIRDRI